MNNLSPAVFFIPVTALLLAGIGYLILIKKETNKSVFKLLVFIITIIAFVLNSVWEIIQMSLYKDYSYDIQHIAFCALASIADVIMVLLLYFGFALLYKNPFWFQRRSFQRIFLLMIIGGMGAIGAELRHTALNTWAYTKSMPVIPFVNVGLIPVLQFMILPACIYYVSYRFIKMKKTHKRWFTN